MRRPFRFLLLLLAVAVPAEAATVPERAFIYIPVLKAQISDAWPSIPIPVSLAGQIEQETCPSLTHRKCWNPKAELKTSREYGFGLGQLTVTSQFNNFEGIKKADAKLKSWKWEDRYDPKRQLRALVVMNRNLYARLGFARDPVERMAFMFSAYNGGLGGVLQDRRLARSRGGDPDRWFGHVEKHSYKAKTKVKGYGKSFFEVNREYVRNILKVRMGKYGSLF